MKQIQTIIALTLLSLTANAQNIQGSYQPKADGQVSKQQVAYTAADTTGQNLVWDLSELELPKRKYTASYTEEESRKDIVIGTEQRTRSYYRSTQDCVMLCGYENNLTKVEYDRPELLLHMPLTYGSRHDGLFHGTMAYCERMFMRVYGSCQVTVDGTGCMVLPSGDTLRHVSRVHIRKLTAQQHYPHITTGRELKAYVDSLPYTTDSILRHLATDSLLTETHTYRWYATGYRYPILECNTIGHRNGKSCYTAAYYCSPEEQEATFDEENAQIRNLLAEADKNNGNHQDGDNKTPNNSPIQDVQISVNGSMMTVSYSLTADATVKALVCDISGIVYQQKSQAGKAGDDCQMTIHCDGLRHGQYVLYLNVNGQFTSHTVSL